MGVLFVAWEGMIPQAASCLISSPCPSVRAHTCIAPPARTHARTRTQTHTHTHTCTHSHTHARTHVRAHPRSYQCEQTEHGVACTVKGVCGKTAEVAGLQVSESCVCVCLCVCVYVCECWTESVLGVFGVGGTFDMGSE